MQASGFEPEPLAWKAKILTRLDHACLFTRFAFYFKFLTIFFL